MAVETRRYTFDELLALPEDGHSYELLDGELVPVTSPDLDHSTLVIALLDWLLAARHAGHGYVYTAPTAVLLDPSVRRENAPEPDLLFMREKRLDTRSGRYLASVPDLVIEALSDTTREHDLPRGKKWSIYERFGVPHYWIVDAATRTVAQYTWQVGGYPQPALRRVGDLLESGLFPSVVLPVVDLFADISQPEQPLHGLGPFDVRGPGRRVARRGHSNGAQ
jgi:Uma2 family endonuclease